MKNHIFHCTTREKVLYTLKKAARCTKVPAMRGSGEGSDCLVYCTKPYFLNNRLFPGHDVVTSVTWQQLFTVARYPSKDLNILLAQFSFISNLISVSLFLVKESMSSNHVSCFFKFPIFFHVSYACTAFLAKSSLINLFCPLNHTGRGVSFFLLGRINSMVRPFILSIMLSINQTIQWRF